MLQYKINNKYSAPRLECLQLGGKIAEQIELFFYERVTSDFARDNILAECEEQFRLRKDDETAVGWWRGEFWGKWAISGCRVARYKHDEVLTEVLHKSALALIATADEDGYIGTYRDKTNVLPADPEKTFPVMGWSCNWCWNLWCRKYTLWGLLEVYMLTEDERILEAAAKASDQLISMLKELGLRPGQTGTFNGLPTGSIMKPMLLLYRLTANSRYLDFAQSIADDWERPDGHIPNLISNALSMKPVHEWYPSSQNWAKAYEMMSCVDGIIELYRVTGVEKYLTAAQNMYTLLSENELNVLFSVGFNDIFAHASEYQNSISEPCDVIHWMRICHELFALTGEVKYIDTIERAFYNPLLAGALADGKWGSRGVRSSGRHMVAIGQAKMKYSHCCVNNMPRGFLNAAETFVMRSERGLVINLYSEYSCELEGSSVEISGDYLGTGKVAVKVYSDKASDIFLRIPGWSKLTVINGEKYTAPSSYERFSLAVGENIFEISFDMTPTIREFHREPEQFALRDYRVHRFITQNDVPADDLKWDRRATILRGPLLLTRSKLIGNTEAEMFESESICGKRLEISCEPTAINSIKANTVRNIFRVKFEGDGGFETLMCDYATGSNHGSEDDARLFSIWM